MGIVPQAQAAAHRLRQFHFGLISWFTIGYAQQVIAPGMLCSHGDGRGIQSSAQEQDGLLASGIGLEGGAGEMFQQSIRPASLILP